MPILNWYFCAFVKNPISVTNADGQTANVGLADIGDHPQNFVPMCSTTGYCCGQMEQMTKL